MTRLGEIIFLAALLLACSPHNYSDEIKGNERYIAALELTLTELDKLDTTTLSTNRYLRISSLLSIDSALSAEGDTLAYAEAQQLNALRTQGMPYHPLSRDLGTLRAHIHHSIDQLVALNHDLQHNLYPHDSVSYLLNLERLTANKVLEEAQQLEAQLQNELHIMSAWLLSKDSIISIILP